MEHLIDAAIFFISSCSIYVLVRAFKEFARDD